MTMNLKTRYLGFELAHPFVLGASPLVDDLDKVRRAEDAGAAAIVMHSLFEEQIENEQAFTERVLQAHEDSHPEALHYLSGTDEFALTPDSYLEQLRRIKRAVRVPVIASLNGVTNQAWLDYVTQCEQAGADAVELNVYQLSTDPKETAEDVERRIEEMLRTLKSKTRLPVALKLSPFYTSLAHVVSRMERAGADGFVLFNRFYQSDIDVESLAVKAHLELSTSSELLLRLRWLAILSPLVRASLAVTGGVHTPVDAVKALMAGAHSVQVVSEVLKHGVGRFRDLVTGLSAWLEEHEYDSVSQLQGSMNLERCPSPSAYERANYMHVLHSWDESRP
jgi:dihydroorotate dehydrogenase (fumarate)